MVIISTYMLFIFGSVMLCKLLQRNKNYYYKKNHFVSVSSMAYRMKRNGTGLASICILSTMVLVMMLGAGSLYFGAEDSLYAHHPKDINISVEYLNTDPQKEYTPEKAELLFSDISSVISDYDTEPLNSYYYRCCNVVGMFHDDILTLDAESVNNANLIDMDYVFDICFVPLDDYNQCMNTNENLDPDEVLLHCVQCTYENPTLSMNNGTSWRVKKQVDNIMGAEIAASSSLPTVYIVVSDLNPVNDAMYYDLKDLNDECRTNFVYYFDVELDAEHTTQLTEAIRESIKELDYTGIGGFYTSSVSCREEEQADFYGTFGGIFFLGIILSIVFIIAAVLIIYYKQITEGYEDKSRFDIMCKIGMTTDDIRRNVNSQTITVFFMPLILAAIHLCFAFPIVQNLLALFHLRNTPLTLTVMGISVLIFGIFYTVVYKITSNSYFSIVSGLKED